MSKYKKRQNEGMWDLLIPLLCVINILPLIVHLAVYSCGYSGYDWYVGSDVLSDFYCYYKCRFFNIVAFFALVILVFRAVLYREKMKKLRYFFPMGLYCIFVLLSSLFSVRISASLQGNFESFESCFVLIGYVVMAVYAYQIVDSERDYTIIHYGILILSGCFGVIGFFQIFHHDLMDYVWVQKLLMNSEQFEEYGSKIIDTFSGNQVYLSLYNPNYAGMALSMLFAVLFILFVSEKRRKWQMIYGVGAAVLAILVWFTYSRASLLTVNLTVILTFFMMHKQRTGNSQWKILLYAGIAAAVLIAVDMLGGNQYLSRMLERNEREPLESMTTDREGIHICYDRTDYQIMVKDHQLLCTSGEKAKPLSARQGEEVLLPFGEGNRMFYMDGDDPTVVLYLVENTLTFVQADGTYYYQSADGRRSELSPVERVSFGGLEYLGSARGYIWSRVIPMLRHYMLLGSGPDTFAEVYPQEDYAGKAVYADNAQRIIEKGHNDYLTKWVQTGFLSVLALLVFYGILLKKCGAYWKKQKICTMKERIGLGCYFACISFMTACLFNDSTIQASPLFWIFAGIALGSL